MGGCSSRKRALLPILVMAGFAIMQLSGQTQETLSRTGKGPIPERPDGPGVAGPEGGGAAQLIRQLKYFRTVGDFEHAARIFDQLFPPESGADPASILKISAALPSYADGAAATVKPGVANEGAYPVFVSPEHEKRPSADVRSSAAGDWTIYSAAEQWAGDGPRDIRIRKSSDRGQTWAETLVIGDGRPLTRPSLRQISDEAIGLAYVREWDHADGDIWFTRFGQDLVADAGHPVALSLSDQTSPSLATDRLGYAEPYVYIVYAEREGPTVSVRIRVSRDFGASWSRELTIDSFACPAGTAIETAVAYDPDRSALHVAYTRPRGLSTGIATAASASFGASWSKPVFLTAPDLRSNSSPSIAAGGGTVVVVYESGRGGQDRDIGLAYSTDSGRRWTGSFGLAASAARESSPDVRVSDGTATPRFFVSYVEENRRIRVLSAAGSAPGSWTTESSFPGGNASLSIGSVVVLPMPGPGGESSAGALWSDTTADEDIYFSAPAVMLNLASLTVTPSNRDVAYSAGTTSFAVAKTGEGRVEWNATVTSGQDWLSIQSGTSGTNAGTIVAAFQENQGLASRIGSIRVVPADITIPSVSVTVTQAGTLAGSLAVSPAAGLTSTGPVGGPFTPSSQAYTLQNTGGTSIDWTAAKTEAWTTLSAASGTLAPGATATVTVSINGTADTLAAGGYGDTVTFTNTTNGNGNASRPVSLTVTALQGALSVSPAAGLTSTGPVGGPFTPSSQAYTLQNTGGTSIDWTAGKGETWTTLSAASGTLAPGNTATVTVSIDATADTLAAGGYSDTVSFTNTTNGLGTTSRAVALTVTAQPGALSVTPAAEFTSTGPAGGPFTPSSQAYTLQNTGGSSIDWTAAKSETWTTVSSASGTLASGATTTVTLSVNSWANALSGGTYTDQVTFTNTTNGTGNTSRAVSLTVSVAPALSVTPANRDVAFTAGTTTFSISNAGGGTLDWTASVLSGGDWLSIQSGGSGSGSATLTAAFSSNRAAAPRVGIIRVTAAGAAGSPQDVTVTQSWGSITLGLSGQRLLEKAWIIQREYGQLTISVGNPALVPIESYVIYRKTGQQDYQVLQQVAGSTVDGAQWVYNDTFLEPGTSYTYKVAAVDILGSVITESKEITI
jgi:hypothetical protein